MVTILVESYEESGPIGVKNMAEIRINVALHTLANAIYDIVGVRIKHSLFTAEKILNAIKEKNSSKNYSLIL